MQGLILAAGMGKRLGKLTSDRTKGMVKVNGVRLIERAVCALTKASIKRIVIVVGHRGDSLKEFLLDRFPELDLVFVENSSFATTNNIYSLWLARHHLAADDTLIIESDVVFEPDLILQAVEDSRPTLAAVAPFESWMEGTVATLDRRSRIQELVPHERLDWSRLEQYFKTINVYKFSREFCTSTYLPRLEQFIRVHGQNQFYEMVLAAIADDFEHELSALVFEGDWYEIDDAEDLANAETLFAGSEEKLHRLQSRYGGYWRFPKLLDFCYLVNPYFPTSEMIEELQSGLEVALRGYPSGQREQARLAAASFGGAEEQIVVGNGASELIRIGLRLVDGQVGIACPTFNEYLECTPSSRLQTMIPDNSDFYYSEGDLLTFAKSVDVMVLVNPNNPTGQCLPRDRVLSLARALQSSQRLIVDESFIDVAEEDSLLCDALLREHPNIVVIKSVGKGFGVPGIRLGVMASADLAFIERVRRELPIWNINAIGEQFLQALPKYKAAHEASCKTLAAERQRLKEGLDEVPWLRVVPSQANYFLCEVSPPMTSTDLTSTLLARHDILIKDCAGKPGFGESQYVRLAVRNRPDNARLIRALHEFKACEKEPHRHRDGDC